MDVYVDHVCEESKIDKPCFFRAEGGWKVKSLHDVSDSWVSHFEPQLFFTSVLW